MLLSLHLLSSKADVNKYFYFSCARMARQMYGCRVIYFLFQLRTHVQPLALQMYECRVIYFLFQLRTHVQPLALQMYGCRVIQKALESIPLDQQQMIIQVLIGSILFSCGSRSWICPVNIGFVL